MEDRQERSALFVPKFVPGTDPNRIGKYSLDRVATVPSLARFRRFDTRPSSIYLCAETITSGERERDAIAYARRPAKEETVKQAAVYDTN